MTILKKGNIDRLTLILPVTFTWIIAVFFLLIFSFDILDYRSSNAIALIGDSQIISFVIMFLAAIVSILLTGVYLDKKPYLLRKLTFLGLVGCGFSILLDLTSLHVQIGILSSFAEALVAIFLGILSISGTTIYAVTTPWRHRGKIYSLAVMMFLVFSSLSLFLGLLLLDFFVNLFVIGLLAIISGILFYTTSKDISWENDEWPTSYRSIITRPSVFIYFISHFLIYIMIGLAISSFSQAGATLSINGNLFGFDLDFYKKFWMVVLLSDLIFILPSGIISDKYGRKTSIILAVYGILFASLLVGLIGSSEVIFVIAGILLGFSFSLLHPTIDSSLWIDLSPTDAVARYCATGFISLTIGVGLGFGMGYVLFLPYLPEVLNIIAFLMIVFAVLAILPLFWVSDTFPPLEFFLLLVINDGGIPIFHYKFSLNETLKVDLPLISGALTAVGSFMIEATGDSKSRLNLVRHGSHFIISETSESTGLSAVIFSNRNDLELQTKLYKFLSVFQIRFEVELNQWVGDIGKFEDAKNDAEEIFGPLITFKSD